MFQRTRVIVVEIYLVLALLISSSMVAFNSKALKKKSPFKLFVLFALTPVMAVMTIVEIIKEKKR